MSPSKSDFQFTQKDVFGPAAQLFLDHIVLLCKGSQAHAAVRSKQAEEYMTNGSTVSLGEVEDDEWEDAVSEDDSVGGMQMKEARLKHAQRKRFGASLERSNAIEPVFDSDEGAISSGSDDEWEDAVSEDDSVSGIQMKEARLKHAQRKRFGASLERTNAVEPVLDSSECAISSGSDDEGRSPKLTFQRQLIRSRTVSSLTERIQSSGDLLAFSTAPVQPKTNPELRQDSPPAPLLPSEETIERLNAVVFSPDPYGRWAW